MKPHEPRTSRITASSPPVLTQRTRLLRRPADRLRASGSPGTASKHKTLINHLIPTSLWYATLVIIVGLPFHVVIYSLLFAHLPSLAGPFKDWKEALTVLMALAAGLLVVIKPELWRAARKRLDFWLIAAFTVLNLGFGLFTPDKSAAILAIKINVVFLLLFIAASFIKLDKLRERRLIQALLIPAAIVGLFGLAQLWLLPANFLTHFGYGSGVNQIQPIEYLSPTIIRLQSLLFGPNQFGSYVVLPIILASWARWHYKQPKIRLALGILVAILLVDLYGTQSRGSWLGLIAGLFALGWLSAAKRLRIILAGTLVIFVLGFIAFIPTISNSRLAFQVFHSSPNAISVSGGSNELHLQRLEDGVQKLFRHPLGQGLTAAGRASDLTGDSFFTENFYLQIGDQIGLEGLVLFIAILIVVGWRLFQASANQPLARPLLAALIGISVMNLFAHTWSDGATALLWWGAAGAVLGLEHSPTKRVGAA